MALCVLYTVLPCCGSGYSQSSHCARWYGIDGDVYRYRYFGIGIGISVFLSLFLCRYRDSCTEFVTVFI